MGLRQFWFQIRDFAGLSVCGVRVTVLGPDGMPAAIYGDHRMKSTLTNPVTLSTAGRVAFWSMLDRVDVHMVDPVRGGCVVRNLSLTDHQVTFEPDAAGSKLLGSFVSWSGEPHVVDCKVAGCYDLMEPMAIDAGQLLVGDVIRVRTRIVTTCSDAPNVSADFLFGSNDKHLPVNMGYDAGTHPVQSNWEAVVLRTGENGLLAWSWEVWCHSNLSESYEYQQWKFRLTTSGTVPMTEDLRGSLVLGWEVAAARNIAQRDVEVVQMTVERVTA